MGTTLKIAEIHIDGGTQPRASIDEAVVAEYAAAIEAGAAFPPLTVVFDGKKHWLADGFHRILALERLNRTHAECVVKKGTLDDAKWLAAGANVSHGLRRTNADKRAAVLMALATEKGKEASERELAKWCGVSHEMVRQIQKGTSATPKVSTVDSGSHKPLQHNDPTFPPKVENDPGEVPMGDDPEPASPPPPAPDPLDENGKKLPEKLQAIWKRRGEITRMMSLISSMKAEVSHAAEDKDPLYKDLNLSAFQAATQNVYRDLRACVPYAVCPYCNAKGCRACHDQGWVGEFVWKASPANRASRSTATEGAKS